jgi:hypothetical protein
MNFLPEYLMLRGALSIGKNQHFLTGVRGPVQFLLRVAQMFCSAVMITLPILYFFFWKNFMVLVVAVAAFFMIIVLARWEAKWIQMPHMRGKGAKAGVQ